MWLCERRSLHVALHKRRSLHVRHCMQAFFPTHRFAHELMHYLIAVTSHIYPRMRAEIMQLNTIMQHEYEMHMDDFI